MVFEDSWVAPSVPPAFNCQVTTVAHAEQAVKAPTQQSVWSVFVRKRLVVDILMWIISWRFGPAFLTGLFMFSIFVIIESQRQ
jgi:hypothetical protein